VGLIFFGFILLFAEVFVSGFGVLGIGGIIALILGGLILTGGNETGFQVSRWLIIGVAAAIGAFVLGFIGVLVRTRRMRTHSGRESLIGAKGRARTRLDPRGVVHVAGERWDAVAEDPPLEEDAEVIVTEAAGLRLKVKRDPASIKLLPASVVAPAAPEAAEESEG
jgi:membrane-bound serine protease (ClpP class)